MGCCCDDQHGGSECGVNVQQCWASTQACSTLSSRYRMQAVQHMQSLTTWHVGGLHNQLMCVPLLQVQTCHAWKVPGWPPFAHPAKSTPVKVMPAVAGTAALSTSQQPQQTQRGQPLSQQQQQPPPQQRQQQSLPSPSKGIPAISKIPPPPKENSLPYSLLDKPHPQHYVIRRVPNDSTPVIDGRDDDSAWQAAEWSTPFVDFVGPTGPRPWLDSKFKMLWDASALYVLVWMEDTGLFANGTKHDR